MQKNYFSSGRVVPDFPVDGHILLYYILILNTVVKTEDMAKMSILFS